MQVNFEEVRAAVDFPAVLQNYGIVVQRVNEKGDAKVVCPFCKGRRDMGVNVEKKLFNCFRCGAQGNVLDLVAKLEGLSVRDAAIKLSPVPAVRPAAPMPEAKGERFMARIEREFREVLAAGNVDETVKWMKGKILESYRSGQKNPK